ncbi:decapping nuclease DXO homolog isoform X2 [Scaptodrosophila lebanonensis]|uniref:Decapping nuclease n=1 Tax=Drosophila lebanonensis TaxID=7225 RepID=A0A6J2UDL2_DROLE|nr:decapping nuclease DXO homolog isoform X2 [Scaptodrosophila lebanonensis]
MSTYLKVPLDKYKCGQGRSAPPFPQFTKPEPIGFMSINGDAREYGNDAGHLGYFWRIPEPPLDLSAGIDQVHRKAVDPEYFDIHMFCKFIQNHRELLHPTESGALKLDADFVTFRGILRLIMCLPYDNKELCLRATQLNGTIYLSKLETDADREDRAKMTQHHLNMCSWGYKFEQYCLSAEPNVEPTTSVPVNENDEFNCFFRTKLGGLRVIFGAEMDGIKSDKSVDLNDPKVLANLKFVELKTTSVNMTPKQLRTFDRYKSLNWWAQSFLVGIESIFAGLRDNNGIVHNIREFIELKMLMDIINDPYAVVQLDYKPGYSGIKYTIIRRSDEPQRTPNGHNELNKVHRFIPDSYRNLLNGTPLSATATNLTNSD